MGINQSSNHNHPSHHNSPDGRYGSSEEHPTRTDLDRSIAGSSGLHLVESMLAENNLLSLPFPITRWRISILPNNESFLFTASAVNELWHLLTAGTCEKWVSRMRSQSCLMHACIPIFAGIHLPVRWVFAYPSFCADWVGKEGTFGVLMVQHNMFTILMRMLFFAGMVMKVLDVKGVSYVPNVFLESGSDVQPTI